MKDLDFHGHHHHDPFHEDKDYGFSMANDVRIILKLTDRRGRPVRANMVKDLKIKVWTQDQHCAIVFYARSVRHERLYDVLVISDREMNALAPGVIVYRYSFMEYDPESHRGYESERCETVITDQKWVPAPPDDRPLNPLNYRTLEYLQDLIERVGRMASRKIKELQGYIEDEYAGGLDDEIKRAKNAEKDIKELTESLKNKLDLYIKENGKINTSFLQEVQDLKKIFNEFKDASEVVNGETDEAMGNLKKEFNRLLEEKEDLFRSQLKKVNNRIDDYLEKKDLRDSEQDNRIDSEVNARKGDTDRLDTRIDNLKKLVNSNTSGIEDEQKRARLVETDLATSLQRLKELALTKSQELADAVDKIRKDVLEGYLTKDEMEKRISQLIGNAPEYLDTLGELAEKLKNDGDALAALIKTVADKANANDVYTKEKVESRLLDVMNAMKKVRQKAVNAHNANADAIKRNADAIGIINGNGNTVGSIRHAVADANHYTDDQIHELSDKTGRDIQDALDSIEPVPVKDIRKWFEN